jgi:predicted alpha/beta-fold hydrolase
MNAAYGINFETLNTVDCFREFDEHFTRLVHTHFSCAAAYYNAGSCLSHVSKVNIPTLVLHSEDDPIVPFDCCPIDECLANPNIICAVTLRGGHCLYF